MGHCKGMMNKLEENCHNTIGELRASSTELHTSGITEKLCEQYAENLSAIALSMKIPAKLYASDKILFNKDKNNPKSLSWFPECKALFPVHTDNAQVIQPSKICSQVDRLFNQKLHTMMNQAISMENPSNV